MELMSESFTSDPPGEVEILAHGSDPTSVKSTEIDVLEETNDVGLSGFLEAVEGRGLEPELGVVLSGNLSDESLEWESLHESPGGFLVSSDLPHGDGTGSPPIDEGQMGLWVVSHTCASWGQLHP